MSWVSGDLAVGLKRHGGRRERERERERESERERVRVRGRKTDEEQVIQN
jgi:hypothetical protein